MNPGPSSDKTGGEAGRVGAGLRSSELEGAGSPSSLQARGTVKAECCSELLILPGGTVLVRNLTPAVAVALRDSFQ